MATDKAKSQEERRICDGYEVVLELYKGAARVWDVKIRIPRLKQEAKEWMHKLGPDTIEAASAFLLAADAGIPLEVFPGGTTGIDDLPTKLGIPVTDWPDETLKSVTHGHSFKIIPKDSIQLIWAKALEQHKNVEALRTNKQKNEHSVRFQVRPSIPYLLTPRLLGLEDKRPADSGGKLVSAYPRRTC